MRLERLPTIAIVIGFALVFTQYLAGQDPLRRMIGFPTRQELLMNAAASGNRADLLQALDDGADPNAADQLGQRPLIWAVTFGHASIVRSLLAAGADVNQHDAFGQTALIRAASRRRVDLVEILIAAGADPRAHGKNGRTAIDLADQLGYSDVVQCLRNYRPGNGSFLLR